ATAPAVDSFAPVQAGPGATITLKGRNFRNVVAVLFSDGPAASFTVDSSTQIRAVVGMYAFAVGSKIPVEVITRSGRALAKQLFTYFPTATAPNVLGLTLSVAEQNIVQAGFIVGTITGPAAPSSEVTNQNPAGGDVLPVRTR